MDLFEAGLEGECMGVTEGNVDDAVVSEGGDRVEDGGFLSSSKTSS